MKDKNIGNIIMIKFIGSKAKMYTYLFSNGNITKKVKGIKNSALKTVTFADHYQ